MSSTASQETKKIPLEYNLSIVNDVLEILDISKIAAAKVEDSKVINKKVEEIGIRICQLLKIKEPIKNIGDKVMEQLVEEFDRMEPGDQYRVLTVMPKDENREFLQQTFGVSERKARRAKEIQTEKGILSTPNPKPGKRLPENLMTQIQAYYEKDTISRQMPGKKDCVSMVVDGVKQRVQKRQILCTIYETYLKFKEDNPLVKIGFSKFAEQRQKNIMLPGSTGSHVVCVCTYHQNPKLMIANAQIDSKEEFRKLAGEGFEGNIRYQHLLTKLMCNPASEPCWLGECPMCDNGRCLSELLEEGFKELDVDTRVSQKENFSV